MAYHFHNKVVLITGGNSGIGLACVKKFTTLGAQVIATGRRAIEEVPHLTAEEKALLTKVDYQICDVANAASQDKLFTHIKNQYGTLTAAVNNAGVLGALNKKIPEFTVEEYNQVMNINVLGVWFSMQHELRMMQAQGYGAIINLSSIAGLKARSVSSLYSVSKFAINGLTRTAALENAKLGIRINAVCPAATDTAIFGDNSTMLKEKLAATVPLGRIGEPNDIANLIAWLSSDEASLINGATIPIDGGVLA